LSCHSLKQLNLMLLHFSSDGRGLCGAADNGKNPEILGRVQP